MEVTTDNQGCAVCALRTTFNVAVTNSIGYSGLYRLHKYSWYEIRAVIITKYYIPALRTAVRVKFHLNGKFETDTRLRYTLIIHHGMVILS